MRISRRGLLIGAAALSLPSLARAMAPTITIGSRVLDVKGKAAKVFGIIGPSGKPGLEMLLGERFEFNLKNNLAEETAIHWHGLTPPTAQDGVPHLSASALQAGEVRSYDFENKKAGTHWMHSHLGLQEQKMLAAPLIVRETKEPLFDEQEHVIMLHDFTFRDPQEILDELKKGGGAHAMHKMGNMKMDAAMLRMMAADVEYDAMLANDRTLDDPEILRAEKGGSVRLRVINGAAATNMWIDLGELRGALIAVDGNTILPFKGSRFPIAIAQRADIRIELPASSGAWPILFLAEGGPLRSGVIIQTGDGVVAKISDRGENADALDLSVEAKLKSVAQVLAEPVTHSEIVALTGGDENYSWGFNGQPHMMHDALFNVRQGERVEVTLQNMTSMAHPMHLHGHYFKIVALGDARIDGAVRDTILMPPGERVAIQFDADNPGSWAFHCHHLYHQNSGMMASMGYLGAA
jgi:FtsP/CotA-like multicopper oxidase with cupredoxin domain